jgi:homoserine dehydrogenase
VAVSARNRGKDRGVSLDNFAWFDSAETMAREAGADAFVELIGGSDGIAKAACEQALDHKCHVVTANKALIAVHGAALAAQAEAAKLALNFEAAVAGGIPIIKALKEGLAANTFKSVTGILNGTCNYILTTMRETGRDFQDVLDEAQKLGYAEADPTFDIDGIDAAHKLAILASMAFGTPIDFDAVPVEGIRHVSALDISLAETLGYKIKLLGHARLVDGAVEARVQPYMVPLNVPISNVEGVYNAVTVEGDFVGRSSYEGRGAGEGPTASAVVADLIDIAAGRITPPLGMPVAQMAAKPLQPVDGHTGAYYTRCTVQDCPGVLADVAAILRDHGVSIEAVRQENSVENADVPLVLILHETQEKNVRAALTDIEKLPAVKDTPRLIRIMTAAD